MRCRRLRSASLWLLLVLAAAEGAERSTPIPASSGSPLRVGTTTIVFKTTRRREAGRAVK
jgi:hypothetical protein